MKTTSLTRTLALLLSFGLASTLAAQPHQKNQRPDPEERIERRIGFLDQRLDLSDEQEAAIRQALTAQLEDGRAWVSAHPDATREERRAYREAQQEQAQAAVAATLTSEQRQKLEALKAEAREHWEARRERRGERQAWRGRRGGGRHGARAAALAERLDLTAEQQDRLKALRAEQRADVRAWTEANPDASREAKRAFWAEQRAKAQAALEETLTPEQQQALAELEEKRAERLERRRGRKGDRPDRDRTGPDARADEAAPTSAFDLQNYPNPFNPTTEIRFTLREAGPVSLAVYDVQGREVSRLVDEALEAGPHAVAFDASGLPTGTYLYRLTVGGETATGQMALVK